MGGGVVALQLDLAILSEDAFNALWLDAVRRLAHLPEDLLQALPLLPRLLAMLLQNLLGLGVRDVPHQ